MSLIQVLNDNNPLPTKDLTRSLHQVIQVYHPKARTVTIVFLIVFFIIHQETIISTQSSPAYRLLCGGALYQGVYHFLVVLAKNKMSISKVPSYIEAFKKELKITYPGISFFTR